MVKSVKWEKPSQPVFKLNTDSSALNNPRKIGGGGILRECQGNMVYAYTIPLGIGTNNQAELKAASHGVNWCIQHGYRKIHLEVDSELVISWLSNQARPPWNLQEANNTVDHLSKCSHNTDIVQHFYIKEQLPRLAKGSFLLEKLGMASFRRKKLKRIKKPP
ncbi:hypothetical protein KY290_008979 [Solanum tuberosum]|uniref:RNase H type-1 domain-containing protein n=1 Tax=Solanum tuberosum TaxID=4113 RepID=A0ABQ7WBY5_SOLTU|nr:hypothetical protein KY289_009342 [Solanum tuberosum]KAH0777568.1 hypothetical protein KY290_008979 [Solanum tuberosum]